MRFLHWLDDNFELVLISLALSAISIIMGMQVVMRYIFHNSLGWAEEICRYLFIYSAFLGFSYSTHKGLHLQLDFIPNVLPFMKKYFMFFGDAVLFLFCIYMIKPGISVIQLLIRSGQTSPAMGIPMHYVYLSLMFGLVLSILRLIQKYTLLLINWRKAEITNREEGN